MEIVATEVVPLPHGGARCRGRETTVGTRPEAQAAHNPTRRSDRAPKGKILASGKVSGCAAAIQGDLSYPSGKGWIATHQQVLPIASLHTDRTDLPRLLHLPNAVHAIVAGDRGGKSAGRVSDTKAGCAIVTAPNQVTLIRRKGVGIRPIVGLNGAQADHRLKTIVDRTGLLLVKRTRIIATNARDVVVIGTVSAVVPHLGRAIGSEIVTFDDSGIAIDRA